MSNRKFTLHTTLSPEEIIDRLYESEEYEIETFLYNFDIMRVSEQQRIHFPRIKGEISKSGVDSQIDIRMQFDKLNAIALAIMYIGMSTLIIGGYRLFGLNELIFVDIEWIVIPLVVFGFIKQVLLKFYKECKSSKEHLKTILEAKEV